MQQRDPEPDDGRVGTEELERGMRAGHARDFVIIGLIALLLLATVNSGALARWTQRLPSSAANIWLAEQAGRWHDLMVRLGPADFYEKHRWR